MSRLAFVCYNPIIMLLEVKTYSQTSYMQLMMHLKNIPILLIRNKTKTKSTSERKLFRLLPLPSPSPHSPYRLTFKKEKKQQQQNNKNTVPSLTQEKDQLQGILHDFLFQSAGYSTEFMEHEIKSSFWV